MDGSASLSARALERDFEELRRVREARPLFRRWPGLSRSALARSARWLFAIAPVIAWWTLIEAPYVLSGHPLDHLQEQLARTGSTV